MMNLIVMCKGLPFADDSGPNTALIAGVATASVLALLAFAGMYCLWVRRKRARARKSLEKVLSSNLCFLTNSAQAELHGQYATDCTPVLPFQDDFFMSDSFASCRCKTSSVRLLCA
jgi:hypothetical protein